MHILEIEAIYPSASIIDGGIQVAISFSFMTDELTDGNFTCDFGGTGNST
jgi:hypothetical protein